MTMQKATSTAKSLLTVTQAAKLLKVSPDTLRNWEKAGKLIPDRTPGGARRYQLSLIQQMIKEKSPSQQKRGMISISKAASQLGISADTLRNWEKKGLVNAERTEGGARRYTRSQLADLKLEMGLDGKTKVKNTELSDVAEPLGVSNINPIINNENENTTGYEDFGWNAKAVFQNFRFGLFVFLLLLVLIPVSLFFTSDKSSPNEPKIAEYDKKFYDLAATIEQMQKRLYRIAAKLPEASQSANPNELGTSSKNVLAVSNTIDLTKVLEINSNTTVNGRLVVNDESVFLEKVTAPNVLYGLTAGSNITITGDSQNPTISATALSEFDTLATVTGRGSTTNTPVSFLGGITVGNVVTLAKFSSDPNSASNGGMYYNTSSNKYRCYINGSWQDCDTDTDTVGESSGGDITAVTAGNGLTGGGTTGDLTLSLNLPTSGTSTETASNSGLEVSASGLSMLRGCSDGQLLKWESSTDQWECSNDVGGLSSSIIDVQEGGVAVGTNVATLNFDATDFIIAESPAGTDTIAIDYANSGITRAGQPSTITAAWIFDDLAVSDTNVSWSGASTTFTTTGAFTLNPGGAVILGDGGDSLAINTNDWDISTSGAISGATYEGLTITSSTGTLTIANGKTLTANNSLTIDGTDGTTFTFPSSSGTVCTTTTCLTSTSGVTTLTGSANQVLVNGSSGSATSGAVTLTLPQDIGTSSAVTFATLDTGQGPNELYDMNQNVLTTSTVAFDSLSLTNQLTVANGGTGATSLTGLLIGNGSGAFTATTVSAGISGQLSDETGSGALVFATSPSFTTPNIGAATATSVNGLSLTANADGFTLAGGTISRSLSVTANNVTLNQSLQTTDSPTFNVLTVSGYSQSTGTFAFSGGGTFSATAADGSLLDFSAINVSATTEGVIVPQNTNCGSGTAEGQLCWDTDGDSLYLGTGSGIQLIGGAGGGDISAVGSMTSGDAFADASADDDWLGLGGSAGRIEFDDQSTDEINVLSANVGIGDASPLALFTVGNGDLFQVNSSGNLIFNQTSPTISVGNTGSLTINDGTNPLVSFNDDGDEGRITLYGFEGSQKSASIQYEDGGAGNGFLRMSADGTNGVLAEFRDCCNLTFTVGTTGSKSIFGYGLNVENSQTDTGTGLEVNFTQADDADSADVGSALQINVTSSSDDADNLVGLELASFTGGSAIETAISVGSGWDVLFDSDTVDISAAGAISGVTGYSQGSGVFTLTSADASLINLSAVNVSGTTEGLILPQNTNCSSGTDEGQICWDSDTESLYVGTGSGVQLVGGVGAGDITAVGSMTSGDAFADASADDDWLGLGGSAGRIAFDDLATDEVDILNATLDLNANIITNIGNSGTDFTASGGLTLADDIAVNGGDITTNQTAFSLLNTTVTDLNFAGAVTNLAIGAPAGLTITPGGNITFAEGNAKAITITSDLASGARSSYPLTISQANDASNNSSVGLLSLTNSDTGSTATVVNLSQVANGPAMTIDLNTGGSSSRGISFSGGVTGMMIDASTVTTTSGTQINLAGHTISNGRSLRITGNASSYSADFTTGLLVIDPTRTLNTAGVTRTESGNYLQITRSNTVNNGTATLNMTGAVAALSSNCTQTLGSCNDSSNILSLTQSYASATGSVLSVANSGTAPSILLPGTNSTTSGIQFGSDGNSVNLYRSAADTLKTDDAFNVNGSFNVNSSGAITAATGLTSSGTITFSGLSADSAVYTTTGGQLTTTAPTSGTLGYWSRSGTNLTPATANDVAAISSNNTSTPVLALTATGAATSPFTITANSVTNGTILSLAGSGLITGEALDITGTWAPTDGSTNEAIDINLTHSPTSSADSFDGIDLSVTDNTALANTIFGIDAYTVLSGNAAKNSYGISGAVSSSSTTADTIRGIAGWTTSTGAMSSGTRSTIGVYGRPVSTAASTGGTLNMYGGYFDSSSTLSNPGASDTALNNIYGIYTRSTATLATDCTTNCTTNQFGVYVDNGASDTDGTSTKYGLYVAPQTGADSNYGAYFGSYVGVGTSTPSYPLDVSLSTSTNNDRAFRSQLSTTTANSIYNSATLYATASHTTGTIGDIRGITTASFYAGTSATSPAITSMVGATLYNGVNGTSPSGSITYAYSLVADSLINTATGTPSVTVANKYGLIVNNQGAGSGTNGVTITSAAGIALYDTTTATNNTNLLIGTATVPSGTFSIYNSDTSHNYFAGSVGIGDTSPSQAFVVGNGDLFQVNSSGQIAAIAGYTQASGNLSFSGGGTVSVTGADTSLINLSAVNVSGTAEGLILPQATSCASGTANGQVCWDNDTFNLYIGNGTTAQLVGGAGGGDITAVGSMTSADAFADATADDDWLGLGSGAGRIEFDDQSTDEINFLNAYVGINNATPQVRLHVGDGTLDTDLVTDEIAAISNDSGVARLYLSGTSQSDIIFADSDAGVDDKYLQMINQNGDINFRSLSDDAGASKNIFFIGRTGVSSANVAVGNISPTLNSLLEINNDTTFQAVSGSDYSLFATSGTITEDTSGNHPLLAGIRVLAPTITAGSATVTNAATLYVNNAPSATVTGGNYALFVDAGSSRFDDAALFNGAVTLGDATSDDITFTGYLASSILPKTDDTYDLGDNTHRFRDLYLGGDTLHIGTSTTDEGTISYNTSSNILNIGTDSTTNADIAFFTNDLYLDKSTGFVGIGSTGPSAQLHLDGETESTLIMEGGRPGNSGAYASFDFYNNDVTNYVGARIAAWNETGDDDGELRFSTYGSSLVEAMRIDSNGNVGIGGIAPSALLQLNKASTTTDMLSVVATSLTSGSALVLTGPTGGTSGVTDHFAKITSDVGCNGCALVAMTADFDNTGAAVSNYGMLNQYTDQTNVANSLYGERTILNLTGNAAKAGFGNYVTVSSSSTTADTLYGGVFGVTNTANAAKTGLIGLQASATTNATTQNNTLYGGIFQPSTTGILTGSARHDVVGLYGQAIANGASTGGITSLRGFYSNPSATNFAPAVGNTTTSEIMGMYVTGTNQAASDCTTNCSLYSYGLYVDNMTTSTNGTSVQYGVYLNSQSGSDTNYQLYSAGSANSYFAGNVGIANTAPIASLSLGNAAVANSNGTLSLAYNNGAGGNRQFKIGVNSNFDLQFGDFGAGNSAGTWIQAFAINYQAPADSLYVDSSGRVGIGTTSLSTKLGVSGGNVLLDNNTAYQMKDSGGTARTLIGLTSADLQTFGSGTYNAVYNGFRVDLTSALSSGQTSDSAFDIKSSSNLGSSDELVQIGDSGADFMTIMGDGSIGLGTASPTKQLQIHNTSNDSQVYVSSGAPSVRLGNNATYASLTQEAVFALGTGAAQYLGGSGDLNLYTGGSGAGKVILGTAGSARVTIATNGDTTFAGSGGSCTITGAGACSSDARLKRNVEDFSSSLDKIMDLRPVTYQMNSQFEDQSMHYGFIAQEVQSIFPELVSSITDPRVGTHLGLNYSGFVVPMVKAVQELNQKVDNALLTLNENGGVANEIKATTLKITEDALVSGIVTADDYTLDRTKFNQTGVLASLPESETKTVSIADAINALNQAQIDQMALLQNVQQDLIGNQEAIASQSALLADQSIKLENTTEKAVTLETKVDQQTSAFQSFRDQIEAQMNSLFSSPDQSTDLLPELTDSEELVATDSAIPQMYNADALSLNSFTVSETLTSLGETRLATTIVAGDFIQDGTLSITGGNEINVIGATSETELADDGILFIQKNPLAKAVDFFNGLVVINSSGNLKVPSVTVADFKVVANKISGTATIKSGENFVVIDNPLVTNSSRILITPTSENPAILAVTKKTDKKSFTVSSALTDSEDITFDWWMIQEVEE